MIDEPPLRADRTIPWLILAAVILLLWGLVYIVEDLERADRNNAAEAMEREIRLLASLITDDLRKGDYQHVEQILADWGAGSPDLALLSLRAHNGFPISEYRRPQAAAELLQLDVPVEFSYAGSATLTLGKDLAPITRRRNNTMMQLVAALLVVTLLLSALAWLVWVNRRKAIVLQRQREELGRHAQVVESSSDLLFMADRELRYQVVNPAFAGQFGLRPEEMIGRSILAVVGPKDYVTLETPLKRVLAGEPQQFSCELGFPSGERRIFDANYSPFVHGGTVLGVVAGMRDITERERVEEELRHNLMEQEILSYIVHLALSPIPFEQLLEHSLAKLLTRQGLSFLAKGSIFIFDDHSRELVLAAQQGLAAPLLSECARIPLGYCLCGRAGATREIVFADHVDRRHDLSYEGMQPHGHYCVPILGDGDLLGVLNLYVPEGHRRSDREDRFVSTIAGTLATIIRWRRAEERLRESEERYFRILDNALDGIIIIDAEGQVVLFNPSAKRMFGYQDEEVVGRNLADLVIPAELRERHRQGMMRYLESGESEIVGRQIELTAMRVGGEEFPVSMTVSTFEMAGQTYFTAFIRDISERKRAEEQIHTLSQAIEQSPVSVVITDPEGRIEYVNGNFEEITGYSAAEVMGKNPSLLQSGRTPRERFDELWRALNAGQAWRGEFLNRRKGGEIFCEQAHIAPVLGAGGEVLHYLAVKEDITQYKQQQELIRHQAHYDNLTDLPNRFLALDRLNQLIKEAHRAGQRVAVLFLDLDGFKRINDTLGHEIGDRLLIQAAGRLREAVREGDTVGRLGGDEFIVLLGGIDEMTDAQPVAEGLLKRFRRAFPVDGRDLLLTVSIGIACYPEDGESAADLLRNADTAMYHSKQQGRNSYHYFTGRMNQGVERRLALEEGLPGALERGEIGLHYQPICRIPDRRPVAVEALLRWHSPTLGAVGPREFIPIAEQGGLILPISEHALGESLAALAGWRGRLGLDLRLHLNLSSRQLRDPGLTRLIEEALQRTGLPATALVLELTEVMLISGHSYIREALAGLRELGVGLALDDFGTGYSSLNQLRDYPFTLLKIDRPFIAGIGEDAADLALVDAAIAMAHGLGIEVAAEGLEGEGQLARLAARGCDLAQGFLFAAPMPEGEVEAWLGRWKG